jgi:two-component system, OmpR family, alkaline phosphatase synthesis response regulator PhoP
LLGGGEVTESSPAERDAVLVLFVDDDRAIAQVYQLKLELEGYRVDLAFDGETAVEMANRELPDIVFLDIRLPKLDGLGVLQALRGNPKTEDIPVVILSNYGRREIDERVAKLGVADFLMKTETTPAKLVAGLDRWLGSGE